MPKTPAKPLPVIRPASAMDDDTLIKHMNARHMPIAGLTEVVARNDATGERLLRQWHQHCHHRGTDDGPPGTPSARPVNHTHAAPE